MKENNSPGLSMRLFNSQLTSIISISLVLFLLGIIALLFFVAKDLSVYVKENIGFSVIMNTDMKNADIIKMQKRIENYPEVREADYITKEEALNTLIAELGEDPNEFLGFNPLSASIEVKIHSEYANNETIGQIEKRLKAFPGVEEILYRKDLIQAVNENVGRISLMLSLLAAVLFIISYALINNTIRLTIYSKRFLIHTMKLVGASRGFIRRPFVLQNIFSGFIASVIAICLLLGMIYYISGQVANFFSLIDTDSLLKVFVIVIIFGMIITSISAYFSVNRYLKMKRDKLYYI